MVKIIIDGDIGKDDLLKIGTFLADLYHGRKEHIHVNIADGTKDMSEKDATAFVGKMFGDKPHFMKTIKGCGKYTIGGHVLVHGELERDNFTCGKDGRFCSKCEGNKEVKTW